jgi:hypothetical protein
VKAAWQLSPGRDKTWTLANAKSAVPVPCFGCSANLEREAAPIDAFDQASRLVRHFICSTQRGHTASLDFA